MRIQQDILRKKISAISLSWLSEDTKLADFQFFFLTIKGEIGCHWLSEKCMTTNDNGKAGWSSDDFSDL